MDNIELIIEIITAFKEEQGLLATAAMRGCGHDEYIGIVGEHRGYANAIRQLEDYRDLLIKQGEI